MLTVSAIKIDGFYPELQEEYFHPSCKYPEYAFDNLSTRDNHVYEGVRNIFKLLQFDKENFHSPAWNPLKNIISPGDVVVIKPNMVKESHLSRENEYEYIITHGSVLRAITDYAIIALNGKGRIIFADAPETDADFNLICKRNGLENLLKFYNTKVDGITFALLDLRKECWKKKDGVIIDKWLLEGDPLGYTKVSIGRNSEFINHGCCKDYFGATFDKEETKKHHHGDIHEYLISSTILSADAIINVPKLKTHKKAGITCCLKNLVGINGDKNWLPHHTEGTPKFGGDQFPEDSLKAVLEYRLFGAIKRVAKNIPLLLQIIGSLKSLGRVYFGSTEEVVRSGNWYGNDTVWRMILDLNKVLFYFDSSGKIRKKKRKMFCLVDGIIAGDGMGPLHPDPKNIGMLVGGTDPVAVDRVCARLIGFDYKKIPSIFKCYQIEKMPLTQQENDKINVFSNISALQGDVNRLTLQKDNFFKPHFGWKGFIEL